MLLQKLADSFNNHCNRYRLHAPETILAHRQCTKPGAGGTGNPGTHHDIQPVITVPFFWIRRPEQSDSRHFQQLCNMY
jgi:hypothetical protein